MKRAFYVIALIISAIVWSIFLKPIPPWEGRDLCGLATYAFERFEGRVKATNLQSFINDGLTINSGPNRHEIEFSFKFRDSDNDERVKTVIITHNSLTGGLTFLSWGGGFVESSRVPNNTCNDNKPRK